MDVELSRKACARANRGEHARWKRFLLRQRAPGRQQVQTRMSNGRGWSGLASATTRHRSASRIGLGGMLPKVRLDPPRLLGNSVVDKTPGTPATTTLGEALHVARLNNERSVLQQSGVEVSSWIATRVRRWRNNDRSLPAPNIGVLRPRLDGEVPQLITR